MVTSGQATPSASCRKSVPICGIRFPQGPGAPKAAFAFGLCLGPAQKADARYDVKPGEVAGKPGSIIRVWPLEGGGPRRGRCLPHSLPLDRAQRRADRGLGRDLHRHRASGEPERDRLGPSDERRGRGLRALAHARRLRHDLGIDARDAARKFIRGLREASADSFQGVAEQWFQRHVIKNKLRSADVIRRVLHAQVYPVIGERDFASIKRSDIARLLDTIEDSSGPRAADSALQIIRQIMNWHATRDDHYSSPIVRGMSRGERNARDRTLTDDEIRAVWGAAATCGSFGRLVRFGLLTAQRRDKLAGMKWDHLEGNVWRAVAGALVTAYPLS
jgi:hypothetical protein